MAAWDDREYGMQANLDREIERVKELGRAEVRQKVGEIHKPISLPIMRPKDGQLVATDVMACERCSGDIAYEAWPCATAVAAGLA